ncbi:MAG: two-component system response regulator [Frankiales bacterium]|jgi:DNA-binding NarL/FixJ family response regulator|nr:two-component system response regulator [Frankiales bacterium]
MSSLRIVVVDDQALVRAGFRLVLEAQEGLQVVGEAADGDAAVEAVQVLRPDVVLMDIRMPGSDGISATRIITALPDPPKVLILTTFNVNSYVYEALRAGASGFLLKDAPPEELVAAIAVVARGDALLGASITRQVIEQFVTGQSAVPYAAPAPVLAALSALTERERTVLTLVAEGLSNVEIADRLYVAPSTVKTHVSQVLAKLGLRDRVQAVVLAYESGLVRAERGR